VKSPDEAILILFRLNTKLESRVRLTREVNRAMNGSDNDTDAHLAQEDRELTAGVQVLC
jgi:hypothetical protein